MCNYVLLDLRTTEKYFGRCCGWYKEDRKNVTTWTWKHLCKNFCFNKLAGLRSATLFKKKTLSQVFSCEFCAILRTLFLQNTFRWLFLYCKSHGLKVVASSCYLKIMKIQFRLVGILVVILILILKYSYLFLII